MRKRLRRSLAEISEWCQRHRHDPVAQQCEALNRKLRGHYQYYGRPTNSRSLRRFHGSVLVAKDGRTIFKKGYGLANREWNIPNRPDTRFKLYSISKQFTTVLVLQLAAEGHTSAEIGEFLSISPRTVETHRRNLMRKLGLHRQADLIRYALQRGILPMED